MRRRLTRRAVAALSRRIDRPELLAAFYPGARQEFHEHVAIRAILAGSLGIDGTYVDVGTNRGQLLGEAVRVAPHGRHIAFEPIPELASEVECAFPQVDCRRLALGAHPGHAEFCHFRSLDGWSGLRRNPEISDERGDPEYIPVTVSTLDAELGELVPRVVKIDVEGAELEVLEGARALLARARPVVIFEHVAAAAALYETPPGAPWDLLSELGYEVFAATGDGPYTRAAFAASSGVINWLATPAANGAKAHG
ncbi:MAG TPA: FkbM family methyltransferase [Solirubrobacteraceae bacterium]|nr:FkbM family methyltransferase [Solirubrobacteraceae bacterium]